MALAADGPGTAEDAVADGGRLADNIAHFARALRKAGLPVGPAAIIRAVEAAEVAGIGRREDLYWTLHSVFVTKREQHPVFDTAFAAFFRSKGLVEKLIAMLSPVALPRAPAPPRPGEARVGEALAPRRRQRPESREPEIALDARLTASDREVLQRKDFAQMSATELAAAERAVRALALPLDRVRTRRLAPDPRGRRIDPRRTLRASLKAGGAAIRLERRAPVERPPPIVALVDVSGSMADYSRVLLHFLHALAAVRTVHTFAFGTRLTNITRALARKDPDVALSEASARVADWSGGTRIAATLAAFNRDWSRRVLGRGPIVLLVTDGLERGTEADDDADLAREMDRLHRSCRRLIWLNPLLRFGGFEARATGIRAMLPHVDEFRAVHSLEAVADLCAALAARRPAAEVDPRRWLAAPARD